MPPEGFEPAIPVGERPQTHAVDRAATGDLRPHTLSLYTDRTDQAGSGGNASDL